MNLVAKEFVASRLDDDGVLVLSEFAGAADELGEALMVNPYDIDTVADTIARALTMSGTERQARMRALRRRVQGEQRADVDVALPRRARSHQQRGRGRHAADQLERRFRGAGLAHPPGAPHRAAARLRRHAGAARRHAGTGEARSGAARSAAGAGPAARHLRPRRQPAAAATCSRAGSGICRSGCGPNTRCGGAIRARASGAWRSG